MSIIVSGTNRRKILVAGSIAAAHPLVIARNGGGFGFPIALVALGLIGGAALVLYNNLEKRENWTRRPSRANGSAHDKYGGDHVVIESERGKNIDLKDGGRIELGKDGVCRSAPKDSMPGRYSDLSAGEVLCAGKFAPYAVGKRELLDRDARTEQATRKALESLIREPVKRMRYMRQMASSTEEDFFLYSGISEINGKNRELNVLTKLNSKGEYSVISKGTSPEWVLEYSADRF